jgi:hypothetical protein
MNPVFLIGIAVTVFCALALVFVLFASRPSETEKRVLEIAHAPLRIEEEQPLETNQPLEAVFSAVRFLRQRLGLSEDEKLRHRFIAAGLRDEHHTDLYFAIRLLGPVVALLLGS